MMTLNLPILDPMERCAKPKPLTGEKLLEHKGKSKSRAAAEQKIMREAVRLDGRKCRIPKCDYRDMPIDPCHVIHRGMGGNPKLDRTTLESVFAGCRIHHGMYDRGEIDHKFLSKQGTRGLMAFRDTRGAVPVLIGISSPGGNR